MDIKTQNEKILKWLKRGRKITAIKALDRFKCLRLSARIADLREDGHKIKTALIKTESGKWVAEYSL